MTKIEEVNKNEFHLSKYFSLITPAIIFLGMTRLLTYYMEFGVSIVSYLDFTEIITSFFDILILLVGMGIATTFQRFMLLDKEKLEKAIDKQEKILSETNEWKIFKLYLIYLRAPLIIGGIISFAWGVAYYFFDWYSIWEVLFTPALMLFLILYIVIQIEMERKHKEFKSSLERKRFINLIFLSFIFVFGVILMSRFQANRVMNEHSTLGTLIELENAEVLVSDKSNFYIGNTRNYVFFYHKKTKSTDIYPMSSVRKLTIVDNRKNKSPF